MDKVSDGNLGQDVECHTDDLVEELLLVVARGWLLCRMAGLDFEEKPVAGR